MSSSDSEELNDSDIELQEAFARGDIKPGLNEVLPAPKQYVNNAKGLRLKLDEMKLELPWIEVLDSVNKEAPLAPELAAKIHEQEQRRQNQMKNNRKLAQFSVEDDPIANDFKRELMFYRQAQASVMTAFPRLKVMGLKTARPVDYFAEMAKSDVHMQKIRESLMQKQAQQQRSERVKELRAQRKEGKALHVQSKLQRQREKREMMEQVKKVRKGVSKDLSFLDDKKTASKKSMEKRKMKDKKFGYGGKKRGTKLNTKESAADMSEYDAPKQGKGKTKFKGKKAIKGAKSKFGAAKRMGKHRRMQGKSRGRK